LELERYLLVLFVLLTLVIVVNAGILKGRKGFAFSLLLLLVFGHLAHRGLKLFPLVPSPPRRPRRERERESVSPPLERVQDNDELLGVLQGGLLSDGLSAHQGVLVGVIKEARRQLSLALGISAGLCLRMSSAHIRSRALVSKGSQPSMVRRFTANSSHRKRRNIAVLEPR
jgi:hypothetical protein